MITCCQARQARSSRVPQREHLRLDDASCLPRRWVHRPLKTGAICPCTLQLDAQQGSSGLLCPCLQVCFQGCRVGEGLLQLGHHGVQENRLADLLLQQGRYVAASRDNGGLLQADAACTQPVAAVNLSCSSTASLIY